MCVHLDSSNKTRSHVVSKSILSVSTVYAGNSVPSSVGGNSPTNSFSDSVSVTRLQVATLGEPSEVLPTVALGKVG